MEIAILLAILLAIQITELKGIVGINSINIVLCFKEHSTLTEA